MQKSTEHKNDYLVLSHLLAETHVHFL